MWWSLCNLQLGTIPLWSIRLPALTWNSLPGSFFLVGNSVLNPTLFSCASEPLPHSCQSPPLHGCIQFPKPQPVGSWLWCTWAQCPQAYLTSTWLQASSTISGAFPRLNHVNSDSEIKSATDTAWDTYTQERKSHNSVNLSNFSPPSQLIWREELESNTQIPILAVATY